MMPNLGQGGCQATEDSYRLGEELGSVKHTKDIEGALKNTTTSVFLGQSSSKYLPSL